MSEWMASADRTLQDLLEEVSSLKLHVKELGEENEDLRDICVRRGIRYEEKLSWRRHKRYFARISAEHPIGRKATASDTFCVPPIVVEIAGWAGSVRRAGLTSRHFGISTIAGTFQACRQC